MNKIYRTPIVPLVENDYNDDDIGRHEALNYVIVKNAPKGLARFHRSACAWMSCNKESDLWIMPDTKEIIVSMPKSIKLRAIELLRLSRGKK